MGSPIQVAMFFKQGNSGWSEVLAMNGDTYTTLLEAKTEITRSGGLGQLRTNILGVGAELIGIRLSKVGVWRDSLYTAHTADSPAGKLWDTYGAPGNSDAVNPWDAQTVRLECSDSYRRLVYLGGMPKDQYLQDNTSLWSPTFLATFRKYFDYLCGNGAFVANRYGTMVSSKNIADPPPPNVNVVGAAAPTFAVVNGQGQITLNLSDNLTGITQGQKVRILGVRGQPGIDLRKWNGIFTCVNSQVLKTFTVISKVVADAATFAALDWTAAYVWQPQQVFKAFSNWAFEGKTHRKRGVAFGTPRGRVRTQS